MEDFAVPADHRLKIIQSKRRGKYIDFTLELKEKL